jgi:hypothetical protein
VTSSSWLGAAALAACWPLIGSAGGALSVRRLGLPPVFLAPLVFAAGSIAAYVVLWTYFLDPGAGRAAWTLLVLLNATWLVPRAGIPVLAWSPEAAALSVASVSGAIVLARAWLRDPQPTVSTLEAPPFGS